MLQLDQSTFLFSSLLSLIIFLHTFQEFFSALRVLNSLERHINSLGRKLALDLIVDNVNSTLGDIADSSSFATVTLVRRSFWKCPFPDIYNITFLVGSLVCGQRNNSMFSKNPGGHVVGVPLVSLCVGHFDKLQEDGGSSR